MIPSSRPWLPLWIHNSSWGLRTNTDTGKPSEHLLEEHWTYYFEMADRVAGVYNIPERMIEKVEQRAHEAGAGDFLSIVGDIPGAMYGWEGIILQRVE